MSLLIDTNVISELRRPRRANEPLFQWRDTVQHEPKYLSVMTILELEFGALRAEHQNMPHAAGLRRWLDEQIMHEFDQAIIPLDIDIARVCAKLQRIRTHPHNDAVIAATALVHNLTVVTRNVVDFADTGVRIINPWNDPA